MAEKTYFEPLRHYSCRRCQQKGLISFWSISEGPEDSPCPWCMQDIAHRAIELLESLNETQPRGAGSQHESIRQLRLEFEQQKSHSEQPQFQPPKELKETDNE